MYCITPALELSPANSTKHGCTQPDKNACAHLDIIPLLELFLNHPTLLDLFDTGYYEGRKVSAFYAFLLSYHHVTLILSGTS